MWVQGWINEPNPAGQEEENVDFSVHRVESDELESDNELEYGMELESGNELECEGWEMCIGVWWKKESGC